MQSRTKIAIAIVVAAAIAASYFVPVLLSPSRLLYSPTNSGSVNAEVTSPPVSVYGQNGAKTFASLFHLIKRMTIQFNFTSTTSDSSSSEIISYVCGMFPMDSGNLAYKVNLTDTSKIQNGVYSESALVWVDPSSGSVLQVSMDGQSVTGTQAQKESGILSFISTDYWLSLLNSSTVTQIGANHTVNLGSTQLYATTYEGLASFPEFQNMVIIVGSIPQNGMQLVLSASYLIPGNGNGSFRVLSLTLGQSTTHN